MKRENILQPTALIKKRAEQKLLGIEMRREAELKRSKMKLETAKSQIVMG
ncbi:4837_t:CDS:2 [Cetraspora pellucida]|uniref:4837_t:CDS:1 n=1 Tax=Cetraspora pellucida TaxID=1433469 RepID=A0A9N9DFE8_9GLOM|nr:4837_t:CDS:2 [Cetraspora pellucida]